MDRTDRVMASFIQDLMQRAVRDALSTAEPHHPFAPPRAEAPAAVVHTDE